MDIFNDDVVLPKNCLEVENARYGRLPCVNDDDERLSNRMAAVQDDLVAILLWMLLCCYVIDDDGVREGSRRGNQDSRRNPSLFLLRTYNKKKSK